VNTLKDETKNKNAQWKEKNETLRKKYEEAKVEKAGLNEQLNSLTDELQSFMGWKEKHLEEEAEDHKKMEDLVGKAKQLKAREESYKRIHLELEEHGKFDENVEDQINKAVESRGKQMKSDLDKAMDKLKQLQKKEIIFDDLVKETEHLRKTVQDNKLTIKKLKTKNIGLEDEKRKLTLSEVKLRDELRENSEKLDNVICC
jgi:hypothetical protein